VKQITGSKIFDAGLFDSSGPKTGIRCSAGLNAQPSAFTVRPTANDPGQDKQRAEVRWNGIQFPQVPSYLFIVMQKNSDVYSLQNPIFGISTVRGPAAGGDYSVQWENQVSAAPFDAAATSRGVLMDYAGPPADADAQRAQAFNQAVVGRYLAQNQASNCSIQQLEITVQSAVGSWAFKSSQYPHLADRDLLWKKHSQNCCDSYMAAGRGKWSDRESCALLSSSDFMLGLSASPGTVFPIILDIRAIFACKSAVTSGACFTNGQCKGKMTFEDFGIGQPVVVGLFDQQILSIASSSAVISSQAFSMSTLAAAVSQGG
jgi:hypothetical protein